MSEALEHELYLDVNEKDRQKILGLFEIARTIQLPVLMDKKVVGVLDLFVFLKNAHNNINIAEMMETEIVVGGQNKNMFTFKNSKQQVLPFVDENGRYAGFVNKLLQKCYLPSREYMHVVEETLDGFNYNGIETEEEFGKLKSSFEAILESNYEGLYITIDKGTTLSINEKCQYADHLTSNDMSIDQDNINVFFEDHDLTTVNVIQNIQKRQEVSVSDGGILRVISNIKDFDKIKNELTETRKLAEKYHDELEFLRWEQSRTEEVVAQSPKMRKVINLAIRVAKVDSTVLIQGQSGVGKGVLSKLIHNNSERKNGPFIKIDCGSIPENLLESELFGYQEGSFTGAVKGGKIGLFELANSGTLFLDEIGEMPLNLQMKLLRALQDKEIFRVGGKKAITVDIRIIAATNRSLEEMVGQKTFRKDLYYRLNVVPIEIPPLKDRKEDIKPLIEQCLHQFNRKYNLKVKIEPAALRCLLNYDWPGNVRELENVVEYSMITANSYTITKEDLPDGIINEHNSYECLTADNLSYKETINSVEKKLLVDAMKKTKSTEEMARLLKLDRSTVIRKLQKHKIKTGF